LAEFVAVPHQAPDSGHHSVAIADHAPAVHVAGKRDQPQSGELSRSAFGVIIEAGAAVYDEHSRTLGAVIVGYEKPMELCIAVLVFDAFFSQAHARLSR
jgi:hypothetical protein